MDYDTIAPGYDELYRDEQLEKLRVVQRHLKVEKTDRLLDVGCGTGISTNFFDCECVGVDFSEQMITQGKGQLMHAPAESLPFEDDVFDVVISITAIHNFEDYRKAFTEMRRVLKKDGKMAVTILKRSKRKEEIKSFLLDQLPFTSFDCGKDVLMLCETCHQS